MVDIADIHEGDMLAFVGNPRNLGHRAIQRAQRYNGGDNNGLWRVVHVELVHELSGELYSVGFRLTRLLPWPRGGRISTPLAQRIAEYPFGVLHFPLDSDARANISTGLLAEFWVQAGDCFYNIWGLPFAVARWFTGWARAGTWFCSEYVRAALSHCGAWNGERGFLAIRDGKPVRIPARVEPQRWSPRDICNAPVFGKWRALKCA